MKKFALFMALLVVATAFAADMASAPATGGPDITRPNTDVEVELKWDNGSSSWSHCWYTGAGSWVGNDFTVATLTCYRQITKMRIYCRAAWPNATWEGGRMGVYAFAGGVPGSLLWGPSWMLPTGSGWQDFAIGYNLPTGTNNFIVAWEQYYNYPNADCYSVDSSTVTTGHSWDYYGGSWGAMSNTTGYNNLLLRCLVDQNPGVAPASIGRIKALYN